MASEGMEVKYDVRLRTWLQLMCCDLDPRTSCPYISESDQRERKSKV